jgi:hypothetical protein
MYRLDLIFLVAVCEGSVLLNIQTHLRGKGKRSGKFGVSSIPMFSFASLEYDIKMG